MNPTTPRPNHRPRTLPRHRPPGARQRSAAPPQAVAGAHVLTGLLALLLSLLYMGGIVSPNARTARPAHRARQRDTGRSRRPGRRRTWAHRSRAAIGADTAGGKAEWRTLTRAQAQDQLDSGKVYGALVVPAGFTDSVAALTRTERHPRPALTVLTNPGKGSLGSSLASQITTQAAHQASQTIGKQLTASVAPGRTPRRSCCSPTRSRSPPQVGHPIGTHSGLGLSTFYYTLLLVLAGFMGGNVISNGVDTALGYADNEIGPWHTRRPTVPISRTQTLLLKMGMTGGHHAPQRLLGDARLRRHPRHGRHPPAPAVALLLLRGPRGRPRRPGHQRGLRRHRPARVDVRVHRPGPAVVGRHRPAPGGAGLLPLPVPLRAHAAARATASARSSTSTPAGTPGSPAPGS